MRKLLMPHKNIRQSSVPIFLTRSERYEMISGRKNLKSFKNIYLKK